MLISAALDGWEERLSFLWSEGGWFHRRCADGWEEGLSFQEAIVAVLDG